MMARRNARRRLTRSQSLLSVRGFGGDDGLRAHGGIFRHDGPQYPYQSLNTSAYNDGALGQDPELVEGMRRLTIVVGCTGLLVAGILFNMVLSKAQAAR